MKGDFTRRTFDRRKHYSGVRMQQGRVQLDADWNEQMEIMDYRQRLQFADFLGTSGAPHNSADAFKIDIDADASNQIIIHAGRYYVEGLLCENESIHTYSHQPYLPNALLPPANQTGNDILYLAYIDAWQRHVTALEDPTISEVALNGADTCTRLQNVAQVKLLPITNAANLTAEWNALLASAANSGFLTPVLATNHSLQNQLYRIEIHDSNPPTFKWSRDNAYIASRITFIESVTPEVEQTPQGPVTKYYSGVQLSEDNSNLLANFEIGDWIEISNVNYELHGQRGHFGQIIDKINNSFLLVEWHIAAGGDIEEFIVKVNALAADLGPTRIARRWESKPSQILPLPGDGTETLYAIENGLSIKFGYGGGLENTFKTGDYWLIPTRALTNDIEWPKQTNNFITQPPHGMVHHYAQLALLRWQVDNTWNLALEDLRIIFPNLRNLSLSAVQAAGTAATGTIYIDPNENVGIGLNIDLSNPANNPPPELDSRLRVNGTIVATDNLHAPTIVTDTLQVVNPLVGNNIITTVNVTDDAITTTKVADDAITETKIAADAVTEIKISDNAITTNKVSNSAITGPKIAASAITVTKIATGAITEAKIANDAVTETKIIDSAITTNKVSNDAITTSKIIDNAVTEIKISDNAVTTNKVINNAITASKIAVNAVTETKIIDNAVTTNKVSNDAITASKIAVNAVTETKIIDNAVTTNKVSNNAITNSKIADNAITVSKIVDAVIIPAANKIPKADSLGRLDSNWLGNYWSSPGINPPVIGFRPAIAKANGKIYVMGGQIGTNGLRWGVDEYDPQTNTWSSKTPIPNNITSPVEFGATTFSDAPNDKIYVHFPLQNAIYEFNPNGGTNGNGLWTQKINSVPPQASSSAQLVTWNNKIFIIGGFSSAVILYNPADNSIRPVNSLATGRFWHTAAVANNKIYVFGGRAAGTSQLLTSVEEFDPTDTINGGNGTWSTKPNTIPFVSSLNTAATIGNRIYLMGGLMSAVVRQYDSLTDTWPTQPAIPNVPNMSADLTLSAVVNNKIYVISCTDILTGTNTMDIYTPLGNL